MKSSVLLVLAGAVLIATAHIPAARAATASNGIVIGWSTNTYVPPDFRGKRLPTAGSTVSAWVMFFSDGKLQDISNDNIQWLADGNSIQSGIGLQKVTFKAPASTDVVVGLEADVQMQDGTIAIGGLQMPVVPPRAVIETGYPGGVFTSPAATAQALPYFFNISDPSALSYTWTANGQSAQGAESPDQATVDVTNDPSGTTIRLGVTITNSADSTTASAFANFTYQKI